MLLTHSVSVPLDVLNNRLESIARIDAKLHHLYGDWARLTLPADAPKSLIHWGTRLRFWISDGAFGYEVDGTVVEHNVVEDIAEEAGEAAREETSEETSEESSEEPSEEPSEELNIDSASPFKSAALPLLPRRVLVLRLSQCRPLGERRATPRRWRRFSVRIHPLRERTQPDQDQAVLNSEDTSDTYPCWERSWAVDISAGGLRLRTYAPLAPQQRLALQFWLPDSAENCAVVHSRCFALCGRVLRSQRLYTRADDAFEAMVGFEQLSADDGLALSNFIAS